jgi:AraC-like DNA-binding protein
MSNPELLALIEASSYAAVLFDRITDVVFFIKDGEGRYVAVNQTLVVRCAVRDKTELLGRTTREVFPAPLGNRFFEQDLGVVASGVPIIQNLELHLYPTRLEGWCLTDKMPLVGRDGQVVGLAGISRDLQTPASEADLFAEIAPAMKHIHSNFRSQLRIENLAAASGFSVYQLNRRLRAVFGITAGQLITKRRIDAASEMLRTSDLAVAEIANASGYYDQSAFSRVFRRLVGLTPRQYRAQHRKRSGSHDRGPSEPEPAPEPTDRRGHGQGQGHGQGW